MAPTEKSLPSLFPYRGSGTELHCVALVRGTAVGKRDTQCPGYPPIETGPGMHAGQGWRGLWELRAPFKAGMGTFRGRDHFEAHGWTQCWKQFLGIMMASESPRAQTSVSGLFFAFLVILLPSQGLVLPKSNNPFCPHSLRHHGDHWLLLSPCPGSAVDLNLTVACGTYGVPCSGIGPTQGYR